ncbi:MAG: hypothetical protein ABIP79_14970 [Chitinophagaceae bacterium]
MPDEKENTASNLESSMDSYPDRNEIVSFDLLQPWKVISQNNVYIIYLSVFLFAFYSFAMHGFNCIGSSTSLIVSLPIGFAIAFFETRSQEFRRRHRRNRFWLYLFLRTFRLVVWFMVLFFFIMVIVMWLNINTYETISR